MQMEPESVIAPRDVQAVDAAIRTLNTFMKFNQDKIDAARRLIAECRSGNQDGGVGGIASQFGPVVSAAIADLLEVYCLEHAEVIRQQMLQRAELAGMASQLKSGLVLPVPFPPRSPRGN